jgi:AMMECR1 domain-containing protein
MILDGSVGMILRGSVGIQQTTKYFDLEANAIQFSILTAVEIWKFSEVTPIPQQTCASLVLYNISLVPLHCHQYSTCIVKES